MRISKTTQITVTKEATLPKWMELAMDGRKIDAIKAIREDGGKHEDRYMSLVYAKNIVEAFMNTVTEIKV